MPYGNFPAKGIVIGLLVLAGVGCFSQSEPEKGYQSLSFSIVDSLLGDDCAIGRPGISFRPPRVWRQVEDSLLQQYQMRLQKALGESPVRLAAIFLDSLGQSGVTASVMDDRTMDTAALIDRYRQRLFEMYDSTVVTWGEFSNNNLRFKQAVISDPGIIRFHLLVFDSDSGAFDLQYFCPRSEYMALVKAFESSIGSIKPLTGGNGSE